MSKVLDIEQLKAHREYNAKAESERLKKKANRAKVYLEKDLNDFADKMRCIKFDDETHRLLFALGEIFLTKGMIHRTEKELASLRSEAND